MANVSVYVRFRPQNKRENLEGGISCVEKISENSFVLKNSVEGESLWTFDHVLFENSSQEEVFDAVAKPIIQGAFDALNGTILAYGQTGAGKTHSMEGPDILLKNSEHTGILPRCAREIFHIIKKDESRSEFIIKLSMIEIYCEKIRDLFDLAKDNLSIKEDKVKGIFVAEATETYIQGENEMLDLLKAGIENRAVGATLMNEGSSRSHCIFEINIQKVDLNESSTAVGKIFLVDLAGSEKVEKTGAEGKLLEEAKTINKSLSALGNVINSLTTSSEKICHIPYRDSKLTRILQESLGGNSKTALLCCCSPSDLNFYETLSTLRFGNRAKKIQNKPTPNLEKNEKNIESLLYNTIGECNALKQKLKKMTSFLPEHILDQVNDYVDKPIEKGNDSAILKSCIHSLLEVLKEEGIEITLAMDVNAIPEIISSRICSSDSSNEGEEREEELEKILNFFEQSIQDLESENEKLVKENQALKCKLFAFSNNANEEIEFEKALELKNHYPFPVYQESILRKLVNWMHFKFGFIRKSWS